MLESIPQELRDIPRWVAFRLEEREVGKKLTKVPVAPATGGNAKANDPETWGTIEQAQQRAEQDGLAGVGFVFTNDDDIFGVDLDHCRDPETGEFEDWAQDIVTRLDSYTELSPSGTGVHVIARGQLPAGRRRTGDIEMYESKRFFTMTGRRVEGTPDAVESRQAAITSLHAEVFGQDTAELVRLDMSKAPEPFSDDELLTKARCASNGPKFEALWSGDLTGYPSHSEADIALCSSLAFWSQRDAAQIDRLFRQSGLFRPKWDEPRGEQTYGEITIAGAIQRTTTTYSGARAGAHRVPGDVDPTLSPLQEFVSSSEEAQAVADDAALGPLPTISVTSRQLRHITGDAVRALKAQGTATQPAIFRRHGSLVVVVDSAAGKSIEVLTRETVSARLARAANWMRWFKEQLIPTAPPMRTCGDLVALPPASLPQLDAIATCPTFSASGTLLSAPGYHAEARLLLIDPLVVDPVPEEPTAAQVAAAREVLDTMLQGFPFACPADYAHAIGIAVTPFVRRMITPDLIPLHCVEAPTPGSGKGLLCESLLAASLGGDVRLNAYQASNTEMRKTITSHLVAGARAVVFDNVPEGTTVQGAALAALLTSSTWSDRILGYSKIATIDNDVLWLLTANNPRFSTEIARRTIRVRLDPKVERPWERNGFSIRLPSWARANRSQLAHALLVLAQNWIAKGRPYEGLELGSFETWSRVVGGIVAAAGYEGFLGSRDEIYATIESETEELEPFIAEWWEAHGEEPVRPSDLAELCRRHGLLEERLSSGGGRSRSTTLGKLLAGQRGRVIAGFRVDIAAKRVKASRAYQLSPVATDPGAGTSRFNVGTSDEAGSTPVSDGAKEVYASGVNIGNLRGDLPDNSEEKPGSQHRDDTDGLLDRLGGSRGSCSVANQCGSTPYDDEPPRDEVPERFPGGSSAALFGGGADVQQRAGGDGPDESDYGALGPLESKP